MASTGTSSSFKSCANQGSNFFRGMVPSRPKGWGGMVLTACCLGRLGLSAGGVWSRGGLRLPHHTPQKVRTQVWSEWKENFTTKLPRTTLGTGHGKRILPALRTGLARLKSPCVPQGVVCFLSFFLARTGTNTAQGRERNTGVTPRGKRILRKENSAAAPPKPWAVDTFLPVKSLCGGGVPSSIPLCLYVFFLFLAIPNNSNTHTSGLSIAPHSFSLTLLLHKGPEDPISIYLQS